MTAPLIRMYIDETRHFEETRSKYKSSKDTFGILVCLYVQSRQTLKQPQPTKQ